MTIARPITARPITATPIIARAIGQGVASTPAFNPGDWITDGNGGYWPLASQISTLFQTANGEQPFADGFNWGDPVGL
ncbi:MAG: hypothetical protein AAF662_14740, partial [Pseudomonadota bacterium]